ncbi:uncharacterized protein LOC108230377 isoform X2 [Kryptolebias marmoratus]|uniref:uncharacterized protein LOC108230377 isoform X2 n=1 Tax=Kryptolebias marmoratus TaxID=37003 RepID=UPI0018ACD341|nr:uncharacterized protein LOC108230377 isoform X2 [Kryptolebias marmoratus]
MMDFDETHCSQCPAHKGMVRRNVEDKRDESSNKKVELSAEAKTSGPKISLRVCCCVCRDCGLCRAHRYAGGEDEDARGRRLCAGCGKVEDIQRGEDKGTTAALMPNTKHKARVPVARRQLTDGDEAAAAAAAAAALGDQSPRPFLTVTGTVRLVNSDPRVTSSRQASNQHHTDFCKQEEENDVHEYN